MSHEELARNVLTVMCDSLGAEWDIDRLTPMALSAAKTVSTNLRSRTVDAIRELVKKP
jgi:hypothetical protein